ncbi:Sac2 family-domain-containing protein [Peziza echinospora]|nr:Sac2 family-domain-containing protein [Peziza echinospora]
MWRPGNWSSGQPGSAAAGANGGAMPQASANRRRPQLPPRSTSLTAPSNVSTVSLQGQRSRKGTPVPPAGLKNPLEVLSGILGAPINSEDVGETEDPENTRPSSIDAEIEFGSMSLEDFVDQPDMDDNPTPTKPNEQSVEEYEQEKDKFHDLHRSIKACDEVLKSVESYLSSFQIDLGLVSAEIETLQTRSQALNRKLENRKTVEQLLGPIVEDIALAPHVVRKITEGEVNDGWVRALQETELKIKSIQTRDPATIKAIQDVKPELDRLTNKAIERIREYFVTRIKALRVPNTNAQHIHQNGFLKMKELFDFMANHNVLLADEIGQAYINTMRWYYHSHFQRYHKALEKLKLHMIEKYDALGHEDLSKRGALMPSLKSAHAIARDPFSLGRRIETLRNREHPALKASAAEEDKSFHYIEVPFRHFNYALMENASAEYTFITEFFSYKSYEQASNMFQQIFSPTFTLGQTYTKSLIEPNMDAIGVLLCVRLNNQFAFELQRRRVPAVDGYINATNMLLWPRFQIVMDSHCESLRKHHATGGMGGGRSAMAGDNKQSTAPHLLTQRFGQFMHAILALSSEAGDDEPTANSLGRLRGDFEGFLTRLGNVMTDGRKKERFLFNNYSLVLTIISDTDGKLASEQKEHFEAMKRAFKEQE